MADTKLSALTALTQSSLDTSDEFYVAHSSGSYRIARSELDKQWVQTSLANVADGYAAFDGSGDLDAKVIILNETPRPTWRAWFSTPAAWPGRPTPTNCTSATARRPYRRWAPVNPPAVVLTPSGAAVDQVRRDKPNDDAQRLGQYWHRERGFECQRRERWYRPRRVIQRFGAAVPPSIRSLVTPASHSTRRLPAQALTATVVGIGSSAVHRRSARSYAAAARSQSA